MWWCYVTSEEAKVTVSVREMTQWIHLNYTLLLQTLRHLALYLPVYTSSIWPNHFIQKAECITRVFGVEIQLGVFQKHPISMGNISSTDTEILRKYKFCFVQCRSWFTELHLRSPKHKLFYSRSLFFKQSSSSTLQKCWQMYST